MNENYENLEFPIYRKAVYGNHPDITTYYTKVDQVDGKLERTMITVDDVVYQSYEVEFESDYKFDESGEEFNLGLNEYVCSEQTFKEVALGLATKILVQI